MNQSVGAAQCNRYEEEAVYQAIKKSAALAGNPAVKGKTVLLKPNILSAEPPEKAIVTHPVFVACVIRLLKELGAATIYVGDSPGVASAEKAGQASGIRQAAENNGALWADFSKTASYDNPQGRLHKRFELPALLSQIDCVISLPKCKTHAMLYFTGALKNLFGLINGIEKSRFHFRYPDKMDFSRMLIDLNLAVKPSYAFMDAIVSMEGQGPGSGSPYPLGLVFASANLMAVDEIAASIIGYDPAALPMLLAAQEAGMGLLGQSRLLGLEMAAIKPKNYQLIKKEKDIGFIKKLLPPVFFKFFKNLHVKRPFFLKKRCIGCMRCVKICPPKALTQNKPPRVDYSLCIRCYCCHEVCPAGAIRLGHF